jgi:hypothetical protein
LRRALPVESPERGLVVEVLELSRLVHRDDSTSLYRTSTYDPTGVSVVCS